MLRRIAQIIFSPIIALVLLAATIASFGVFIFDADDDSWAIVKVLWRGLK